MSAEREWSRCANPKCGRAIYLNRFGRWVHYMGDAFCQLNTSGIRTAKTARPVRA